MQLVVQKPYTEYNQYTRNRSDNNCSKSICYITGSRNGNQTCQRSIQTHGYIRLAIFNPGKNHTHNCCNCRSNCCCYKNRTKLFYRGTCCTVKSIPAKPQNKYTKGANREVMSRECMYLCYLTALILCKFANAGSQNCCTNQCTDTTYHMNCTGTCEIMETKL